MIFKFFLLFLFAHILKSEAYPDGKQVEKSGQLIISQLIWRHGDRAPVQTYPGDKYGIEYWPEGWGQLTNLGKQQQFALGQWLRARYSKFLSTTFNVSDVYIKSSDVDRTLMSAEANLAGLFAPVGSQVWNKNLLWQPIPVHTVNVTYDYLISGGVPANCPAYYNAYNAYLQSNQIRQFDKSIQSVYNYLTTSLGTPINNWLTVLLIRDTLLCESIHNLTLPAWSKSIFPNKDEFYEAALKYYYASSATPFLAKFAGGFLLKDILDRATAKVQGTLSPNYKYYAYSTHDSTISNFLNTLGVFDFTFVNYASLVILELRYYQSEYYVTLYYRNNNQQTVEPIFIPQCGTACPLWKMQQLYAAVLPKNSFDVECKSGV